MRAIVDVIEELCSSALYTSNGIGKIAAHAFQQNDTIILPKKQHTMAANTLPMMFARKNKRKCRSQLILGNINSLMSVLWEYRLDFFRTK
jgi:allophanate hydrolase subunit 2